MVSKTAFLFPGQGSQVIGMGKSYFEKSPAARVLIEKADKILGFPLSQIMFEGPEEKLKETDITQPALYVTSAAGLEITKQRGISFQWAAGHSLGEYSALYAAGAMSFEDGLMLVRERGRAMSEAGKTNPGTMAAIIGLGMEKLQDICRRSSDGNHICVPANYNSESQIVISGSVEAVLKAMELCTAAGAAKVIQLNVAGAFHSPLMKPAAEKMKNLIDSTHFNNTSSSVLTNVDAKETNDSNQFKQKLFNQIDHAVLWDATLKELIRLGAEIFIEVGSGRVLSTMIKKLDRKKTVLSTDDVESLDKIFAPIS